MALGKVNLALHSCCKHWTDILDKGKSLDVVYLDYKKAFDSVPYERLLTKLYAYGIRGKVLAWIRNFLTNRFRRVVINGTMSKAAP